MKPEDIRKLNRIKTYIVLQQGKSKIANLIQKYSKEYCQNKEFVPTHLLMFKFRFGKWWVYESTHSPVDKYLINGGVRHYEADIWLELEKDNLDQYRFYEVDLDYYSMEKYIGQPYGYGDIKELMLASIRHSNGLQKDYKGLICSEYGALCCKEVRDFYGELPTWCITPAHFQNMFNVKGKKGGYIMNIQEIVSVVTLGINVAAVGYIYGQMKEQLKNQNATLETFKQNFNEKFKDFKEAVSEHFVRVEKKQDIHNRIIERTYNLERQANVQDEQIKVINHRIEDLEELNK